MNWFVFWIVVYILILVILTLKYIKKNRYRGLFD